MASKKRRKTTIDPVYLMGAGVVLVAIAFMMLIFQSSGEIVPASIFAGPFGQIGVAFITGLTTGGLSCLAVQGGLLASSLARQIEKDLLIPQTKAGKGKRQAGQATQPALPIALFLLAKLAAYTLLGALLGWLGSFLSLDPISRAVLMIAIGVFMLGNALRMLDVHPIFRYFAIEPPKFITRTIRRTAKNGTELATPLFLGALTVFIPCGVTQAMMGAALATGRAGMGAALMFAFTLGTSPIFFLVAYLAAKVGEKLEAFFMRFVAIAVLVLGLITMNSGLNLIGSPLSFENVTRGLFSPTVEAAQAASDGGLTLFVKNEGYFPQTLRVKANSAVALNLVTDRTYSCARDFVIPALGFYELLPDTGTVVVNIPSQAPGTRMFFTCSMGMYTGMIVFD